MHMEQELARDRQRAMQTEASRQRLAHQARALGKVTRRADRAQRRLVQYRREAARLRRELVS